MFFLLYSPKFTCLYFSHPDVRIFRGFIARQYLKQLRVANVERQRKAAVTLQRYVKHVSRALLSLSDRDFLVTQHNVAR